MNLFRDPLTPMDVLAILLWPVTLIFMVVVWIVLPDPDAPSGYMEEGDEGLLF